MLHQWQLLVLLQCSCPYRKLITNEASHPIKFTLVPFAVIQKCSLSFGSNKTRQLECDELDKNRPDICIGTDRYHTSEKLQECLSAAFKALGYDVAIDSPFTGTIVPLNHYYKDQRVESVMIEVNRSLYDDPNGFTRIPSDLSHAISQAATISPYHNLGE